MAGLFEGYIKNQGLDPLVDPMVNRWHERTASNKIKKSFNKCPAKSPNKPMEKLLISLVGGLGGETSMEQAGAGNFGTKSQINKMKDYLGF